MVKRSTSFRCPLGTFGELSGLGFEGHSPGGACNIS